jgi:hypothetical protein
MGILPLAVFKILSLSHPITTARLPDTAAAKKRRKQYPTIDRFHRREECFSEG